jgi:Domain of unknown function (DUF1905)
LRFADALCDFEKHFQEIGGSNVTMEQYKFKATIQAVGVGACVLFPYDVQKEFGTRGQVPVNVSFDGVPYSESAATIESVP